MKLRHLPILAACSIILASLFAGPVMAQRQDQASLLLDLKKARASYDSAKQKMDNDKKLFDNQAISGDEYTRSKNDFLGREVDYQKLILKVMNQQSYIIVQKAIKYQSKDKKRKVKVVLKSTAATNEEFLNYFKSHSDIFSPEMRQEKVYNIFVSLMTSAADETIIADPYEAHVPSIEMGKTVEVHFTLLRDVESLQILLNYGDRSERRTVLLQQDASANIVDINSRQFSQEANLGGRATYDLNLERFSSGDDIYKLEVVNLPRQATFEFLDTATNARISQTRFPQGVTSKRLSLVVYLPDRADDDIITDEPLEFFVLALPREEVSDLNKLRQQGPLTAQKLNTINAGRTKLELIPRGVGRIEIAAPTLYHEIKTGEQVQMNITVKNTGTRRLDNVKISTDNPLNWRSIIEPDLISSLEVEQKQIVKLTLIPPDDTGVGAQEVKIKSEAMANNRSVQTEDKTVRIKISAKTPLLGSLILIIVLIFFVVGTVVFGIKLSRR
ncbi:hypothetical protein KAR48_12010 [bacterium]|nr:hypothetical protein [bacterium]